MVSRTKIDKAGKHLSEGAMPYNEQMLEFEMIFDDFRKKHLKPLTKLTLELQSLIRNNKINFHIAQRLKRKPQIMRKLRRFSVRLTQLQDIGGCRIILEKIVTLTI